MGGWTYKWESKKGEDWLKRVTSKGRKIRWSSSSSPILAKALGRKRLFALRGSARQTVNYLNQAGCQLDALLGSH